MRQRVKELVNTYFTDDKDRDYLVRMQIFKRIFPAFNEYCVNLQSSAGVV